MLVGCGGSRRASRRPLRSMPTSSASVVLMLGLPWETWERLILWMATGVAVYVAYGFRRSRLRQP